MNGEINAGDFDQGNSLLVVCINIDIVYTWQLYNNELKYIPQGLPSLFK